MRLAIERVIAELAHEMSICELILKSDPNDMEAKAEKGAHYFAIRKLKEVIASEEITDAR